MKNNKGFTLVELLAVIIVLGIILTIVIPSAITTIDNSNRNVFATSAKGLIDGAKAYVMNEGVAFPSPNTYIAVSIQDIAIENKEIYENDGGVIIANHGTTTNPSYGYYAYLANADYSVNGIAKLAMRDYVSGGTNYSLPILGTVYINQVLGLTGTTDGIVSAGGGYTAFALYD